MGGISCASCAESVVLWAICLVVSAWVQSWSHGVCWEDVLLWHPVVQVRGHEGHLLGEVVVVYPFCCGVPALVVILRSGLPF